MERCRLGYKYENENKHEYKNENMIVNKYENVKVNVQGL